MDTVESMSVRAGLHQVNLPLSLLTLLALILILSLGIVWTLKKQKYTAAPIACVSGTTLSVARERFRKDAREMLREGYKQACPSAGILGSPSLIL